MSDLSALIARLEALEGPDREVDGLLWAELSGRDVRTDGIKTLAKSRRAPFDECVLFINGEHGLVIDRYHEPTIPSYTASLDAAVALVGKMLPGYDWGRQDGYMWVSDGDDFAEAKRPHAAIALLIALLKSLANREGRDAD